MNKAKSGNLAKMVAFFLIALILTCTVAFATSEWQPETENEPDSGEADGDNSSTSDTDENKDGNENTPNEDIPVVKPVPEYLNYITGTEIMQQDALKKPMCFVYETNSALYGISSSFLTIEFPTDDGKTRFLTFTNDATSIGKIGTLAPTRKYISNLAAAFGGVIFSYGNDDSFVYEGLDTSNITLDFKLHTGYHYTEFSNYAYTNADLISAFINNSEVNTVATGIHSVPYNFVEYYGEAKKCAKSAKTVVISYKAGSSTELNYLSGEGKYVLTKNNQQKIDLLNDEKLAYNNAFILFANSTTHETEDSTQMVLDTMSGGKGYYLTGGTMEEITWGYDTEGNLTFYNITGEKLTVNRGTSYISFAKSSQISKVTFS